MPNKFERNLGNLRKRETNVAFHFGGTGLNQRKLYWAKKPNFSARKKKKKRFFFWLNHMTFIFTHQIYKIKK